MKPEGATLGMCIKHSAPHKFDPCTCYLWKPIAPEAAGRESADMGCVAQSERSPETGHAEKQRPCKPQDAGSIPVALPSIESNSITYREEAAGRPTQEQGAIENPAAKELKAAWTAWLEDHGVPISWEFVRLANAVGAAIDELKEK